MAVMILSNALLTDLPDELLLIILKKLNNIDVFYSLFGFNSRLNQIIRDPCCTTEINLIDLVDYTSTQMEIIVDRFSSEISPNIDHLIRYLKVPSTMMERILLSADYPNLSQLDIFIPHVAPVIHINDESFLTDRFKNRTLVLSVTGIENNDDMDVRRSMKIRANLFTQIFKIFPHIQQLKFYESLPLSANFVYFTRRPSIFSSKLVELHVDLYSFQDLLYLIDGRFDHLQRLIVKLKNLWLIEPISVDGRPITNLKEFSFTCVIGIDAYHDWIVPTFQRMINLEKLSIKTKIYHQPRFIDGNHLKEDIIRHMPRLKDFLFDIRSILSLDDAEIHVQSDEDIRSTLTDLTKYQITTRVDYFPIEREAHCHIHTNPLLSIAYEFISNNFRGELFENVQYVELFDEQPFEHSFFIRIAQSFPSMKELSVHNRMAQQEKQNHYLSSQDQQLPIVRYRSLQKLVLLWVHDDYIEQFLFDTKTNLPSDLILDCKEDQLKRVTCNFTREETKANYSKVKSFNLHVEIDTSAIIPFVPN